MKEKVRAHSRSNKTKSVYLQSKATQEAPTLKELIKQKDIATFFRFVEFYKLREEALKAINVRLSDA